MKLTLSANETAEERLHSGIPAVSTWRRGGSMGIGSVATHEYPGDLNSQQW
jgi:hypothetical protein